MEGTIQSIPAATCNHREIVFDVGTLKITTADIADAKPGDFEGLKEAVLIIVRHQYWTIRTGPPTKTHAQAMMALVGFTVRI